MTAIGPAGTTPAPVTTTTTTQSKGTTGPSSAPDTTTTADSAPLLQQKDEFVGPLPQPLVSLPRNPSDLLITCAGPPKTDLLITCAGPPTTPRYPSSISHGWDPVTGVTMPSSGTGHISQDPANPFAKVAGEPGARTGATFIQVIPTVGVGSPPNSIEMANVFALGGPYSTRGPAATAPQYATFGSEQAVANLLATAKSPEDYAAGLNQMGGHVTNAGHYSKFGSTSPIDGTGKTPADLSPQFALGHYTQVATYLAANPDVQELAKQHPTVHPHVVAEWHFAQQGRAEGREWPKEVTLLPDFSGVVGFGSSGSDPFSQKALQGYLDRNPDVRALAQKYGENELSFAMRHYNGVGRFEGRSMGPRNYASIPGNQGNPDFERYYRGEMSDGEKQVFFGNVPGAGGAEGTAGGSSGGGGGVNAGGGSGGVGGGGGGGGVGGVGGTGGLGRAGAEQELREVLEQVLAALLHGADDAGLSEDQLKMLLELIAKTKKPGKLKKLLLAQGLTAEQADKVLGALGLKAPDERRGLPIRG